MAEEKARPKTAVAYKPKKKTDEDSKEE